MSSNLPATPFRPYRAILAGFCGSTTSMVVLLFSHIFAQMLSKGMGPNNVFYALSYNNLTQAVASNLYPTVLLHFVIGTAFAVLYAKMVDRIPGGNSWKSGLIFGTELWLLSAIVFFPAMGAGFFGLGLGAGVLPVAGSLILHLVYGLMLGLVYSPALMKWHVTPQAQRGTVPDNSASAEKAAALGILAGAGVGVVTVAAALVVIGARSISVGGLPVDYTLMAIVFFCTAMGMLIGFWTGAEPESV